jgi:uncharacterized membrane protein affecting hemolysin expression
MRREINLLGEERERKLKLTRQFRKLQIASLIVLGAYCLVVMVVVGYNYSLGVQLKNLNNSISARKMRITELKKVELQQLLLKQRLSALEDYLNKPAYPYTQVIENLEEDAQGTIVLDRFVFDGKGSVTFTGKAPDAVRLSDFLGGLLGENKSETVFSEIKLAGLSRNINGNYQFSTEIVTSDKSKK